MEEFNTFDEFERSQAVSTASAVIDIENKLYEYSIDCHHDNKNDQENQENVTLSRYSTGYSAHNEIADSKELVFWKHSFPYLRIIGSSMNIHTSQLESNDDSQSLQEEEVILEHYNHIDNESSNSLRDEILSNVFHEIWPDIIDVITPLLVDILKELKYSDYNEVNKATNVWKGECSDDDFIVGGGDDLDD